LDLQAAATTVTLLAAIARSSAFSNAGDAVQHVDDSVDTKRAAARHLPGRLSTTVPITPAAVPAIVSVEQPRMVP
jgi:hypothetical protein